MNSLRRRRGRTAFALYLCALSFAIFLAAPLVGALEPAAKAQQARATSSASVGSSAVTGLRSFDECDRNRDGFLDKSESASVPGLSANFERVDLNKDGKLDREEFQKAVHLLQSERK